MSSSSPTAPPGRVDAHAVFATLDRLASPHQGDVFMHEFVRAVAELFRADLVFVARGLTRPITRARVLAAYVDGHSIESWDFDLAGTPCALTCAGAAQVVERGLDERFPAQRDRPYRCYLGMPLRDGAGEVIGHLAVYGAGELPAMADRAQIMRILGHRAEGEIQRLLADRQRDALMDELERLNTQLHEQSITDPLTRVYNRHYFEGRCLQELVRAYRTRQATGLIVLDVDRLSAVNARHGRGGGDAVLEAAADCLHGCVRQGMDLVARTGGGEFSILCPNTSAEGLMTIAERVREATAARGFRFMDRVVPLTISAGAALAPPGEREWKDLFEDARQALREAKARGRNRVVMGSQMAS